MQEDFHYYATYCAAYIAGYSHEEAMQICYAAQFVDCCSATFLSKVKGPKAAATTQLQAEMLNAGTDPVSLQNITRIWASFHFLPYDLHAFLPKRPKRYMQKYRLLCKPDGELLAPTVNLAKNSSLQSVGIAMHVLADTWAHSYFAGTPTLVINNTEDYFYELLKDGDEERERKITFRHNPTAEDDLNKGIFTNTMYQSSETSVMNLGHGRAGHLPDYAFMRYKYMPAWGNYEVIIKDNPSDYYHAFCQMVYAMKYIRGEYDSFEKGYYDEESVAPWKEKLLKILNRHYLELNIYFKELGRELSGQDVEYFDVSKYQEEYMNAPRTQRDDTFLGRFFIGAMAQKSMVTNKIYKSGNLLAGFSVDYKKAGFKGIRDFRKLVAHWEGDGRDDQR